MTWQVNMENLRVVSEFYDNNGKRLRGAYNTSDDSAVLININTLDRLLNGAAVLTDVEEMTLEQAEKKYGDEIIKKFLASHGVADIFSLEEVEAAFGSQIIEKHSKATSLRAANASRENQKKAVDTIIKKSKLTQAVIIKAVLEGSVKMNIELNFGYSRPTINKALSGLTEQKMNDIWVKYKDTVFENVDRKLADDFISCDCDYKSYMRHLALERITAHGVVEEAVIIEENSVPFDASEDAVANEQADHAVSEQADWDSTLGYDAYTVEMNRRIIAAGLKPVESWMPKKLVEEPVEKSIFEKVLDIVNTPVKPMAVPKIERHVPANNDKYIEMYMERARHPHERPKVDTSMAGEGNFKVLKSRKGMGLYLESAMY